LLLAGMLAIGTRSRPGRPAAWLRFRDDLH
jgi:hypothetical protein